MQGQPVARTTAADGAGRTRSTTRASTPSSTRCRSGRAPWAVCIELPEAWRARVGTLRLRTAPGNTLEVLGAKGAVLATADLTRWTLTLAERPAEQARQIPVTSLR